jgi:ureidoacrylate peracid hydrolase
MDRRLFVQTLGAGTVAALLPSRGETSRLRQQTQDRRISAPTAVGPAVTIEANPSAIPIEPARTALLVVDMQNDFGSEGGLLQRAGLGLSLIRATVPRTATVLAAARAAGIPVIYLKMGFRPDLSDAGAPDSPNRVRHLAYGTGKSVRAPDGRASRILIRDTWNTDILTELAPQPHDTVLYKTRFSGFYQTDLDAILERSAIKNLIVAGWTTSTCVEASIRDAMYRGYCCVLLKDCTAEPVGAGVPGCGDETLQRLAGFGWVSGSEEFVKSLTPPSS